jgi:hypothetical protein
MFRGFESFVGLWHGGGDHVLHLAPADPHHVTTSLGYDFHKVTSLSFGIGNYVCFAKNITFARKLHICIAKNMPKTWF